MQINITGQQLDLTPTLRAHVEEKFQKIERHFDRLTAIDIVLHVEKNRHHAEANVTGAGAALHAHAEADDMYTAIDDLVDKLDAQVRRHKDRVTDHHRDGGALKDQPAR
jgi:putative sigma-54 modulation protein